MTITARRIEPTLGLTLLPLADRTAECAPAISRQLFPCVLSLTTMVAKPEGVVHFYNGRGTAEQWIKEGEQSLKWTRLPCHRFVANQVRPALFVLAYNLGNFLRRLGLPKAVKDWSLRSVQVKLI